MESAVETIPVRENSNSDHQKALSIQVEEFSLEPLGESILLSRGVLRAVSLLYNSDCGDFPDSESNSIWTDSKSPAGRWAFRVKWRARTKAVR